MTAIQLNRAIKGCILAAISLLFAAAVTSCEKKFEGVALPLAINNTALELDTAAGSTHIMVYSTGSWQVDFKDKTDWATLNRTEGSGNSDVVLTYTANTGAARYTTLVLSRDTLVKTIAITQLGQ